MQEVFPTSWPTLLRPADPREAINRQALYEARMATDFRGSGETAKAGFVARLRNAFAGRTVEAIEPCACPA